MSETDNWLERYEKNHQNLSNPLVYWAAVPPSSMRSPRS